MPHQAGLESRTKLPALPGALLQHEFSQQTPRHRRRAKRLAISIDQLAFRMLVVLRVHPHLSNVLTHISGAN